MMITLQQVLVISVILFAIGAVGVAVRRHIIIILLSMQFMLMGAGIALAAFSRWHLLPEGKVALLFLLVVMMVVLAVGLGLSLALFRRRGTLSVDEMRLLRD